MIYFTSDWHLGEDRLGDITAGEFNPFYRPFHSTLAQDTSIVTMCNRIVRPEDTLYHLGDVMVNESGFEWLEKIWCKNKVLIVGNYDEQYLDRLENYFDKIYRWRFVYEDEENDSGEQFYLVHKPEDMTPICFNIVGHIHGLWKVKRDMVNVGVDAWHFRPVSMNEILFVKNAIDKGYYDENVFWNEAPSERGPS